MKSSISFEERAKKFMEEYRKLVEEYGVDFYAQPVFIKTNHGTFEIGVQVVTIDVKPNTGASGSTQ